MDQFERYASPRDPAHCLSYHPKRALLANPGPLAVELAPDARRYQLLQGAVVQTGIELDAYAYRADCSLSPAGVLVLHKAFTWDGPSRPAVQTRDFLRASAYHDAMYRLMRAGVLSLDARPAADSLYMHTAVCDGAPRWRAALQFLALRLFGRSAARPRIDATTAIPQEDPAHAVT